MGKLQVKLIQALFLVQSQDAEPSEEEVLHWEGDCLLHLRWDPHVSQFRHNLAALCLQRAGEAVGGVRSAEAGGGRGFFGWAGDRMLGCLEVRHCTCFQ